MRETRKLSWILILTVFATAGYATTTPFQKECSRLQKRFSDATRLKKLMDLHWRYTMEEFPEYATSVGYPQFQDRWTDRSSEAIERRKQELDALWKALQTIQPKRVPQDQKLTYALYKRWVAQAREARQYPDELMPLNQMFGVQNEMTSTLALMPHESADDLQTLLKRMKAIPRALAQTQALLEQGIQRKVTLPRVAIRKALAQLEGLVTENPDDSAWLKPFRSQPESWKKQARELYTSSLRPALTTFNQFVKTRYLPACRTEIAWSELPNGKNWYAFKIREQTTTALSAQAIHETGLREVARLRKAMEAVQKKAGFEGSLAEFMDYLRTDKRFFFEDAESLIRAYRDLAKRIDPELPRLFGKLPRLPYGVEAIPSYSAPSQPTAYYQPGSPAAGRAGTFFANTYALKSRPNWEMEALTLHEAVPGHHLQIALAQELPDVPDFRKYTDYNAFVEGWGLYAEGLGQELGLYQNPYSEFGKLTYEMWRSIRLVVDTGMHAMGWSREKAIQYFKDNAGRADHDIEQEVDRYLVMPAQALGYKLGQLKILELRRTAQEKLGKHFSLKRFHDAVLKDGSLPLDILERRMLAWMQQFNGKRLADERPGSTGQQRKHLSQEPTG